jgi:type IV secretion system protein VirB2
VKKPAISSSFLFWSFLCSFAILATIMPDLALATGGIDEFSGPMEKVVNTMLGKWGMLISVAGMACIGIVYIFNRQDMSEGFKMFLQVVFGICFIAFATQIVNAIFSFSGAVI